jgi:hypothetical protein
MYNVEMRYLLRPPLIALAVIAALWIVTGSIWQALGWALVPLFFGFCYWLMARRQAETKGSYAYSSKGGSGSTGAAAGL